MEVRLDEAERHAARDTARYQGHGTRTAASVAGACSGKSTLLNILGGLDVPSSGQVLFRDRDLTLADDAALTRFRRQCVGNAGIAAMADRVITMRSGQIVQVQRNATRVAPADLTW